MHIQLNAHTTRTRTHTAVTASQSLNSGTFFHAGILRTASTPTHSGLLVVLCCQLLLRRLLLGGRQRHPVLLTSYPPPLLRSPGPLPSRPPSASLHFLLLICSERGIAEGLTWADSVAQLPRLTTTSRRPRQASARPRLSTSGASRAVPGSPRRPLRLWLRRAAMGAGGCACLTAPPSQDPRDGEGELVGGSGQGRGRGQGSGPEGGERGQEAGHCVIKLQPPRSAVQEARGVQRPVGRVQAGDRSGTPGLGL